MPGQYLRGAFIEFTESFPLPVPNLILFQYNPETMTHTWTPARTGGSNTPGQSPSNPLAITGPPEESFSFNLAMDAGDTIADGSEVTAGLAELSGVAPRLAALEMLLFPTAPPGGGLIGSVSSALGLSSGPPPGIAVPAAQLPTVLFVWGPGRIAAVRVTALTITEKLYDGTLLVPTHAEAQIGLKVLTAPELQYVDGPLGTLANAAATYTQGLREALAIANLANSVESIVGMLPI
ncbi:MAG TPA: hypothetical protein VHV32_00895 [Candidatus Angelobacter sp.]|jgi:hypothetical protein|nr:hypothetical protein [Candidatus Angelobacter sp.]